MRVQVEEVPELCKEYVIFAQSRPKRRNEIHDSISTNKFLQLPMVVEEVAEFGEERATAECDIGIKLNTQIVNSVCDVAKGDSTYS